MSTIVGQQIVIKAHLFGKRRKAVLVMGRIHPHPSDRKKVVVSVGDTTEGGKCKSVPRGIAGSCVHNDTPYRW